MKEKREGEGKHGGVSRGAVRERGNIRENVSERDRKRVNKV